MNSSFRKFVSIYGALLTLGVASATNAFACNGQQLEGDLRWCLDGRAGNGKISGGGFAKDAGLLDEGWKECKQSSTAKENYDKCSPGQRIDTVRAIIGAR